VPLTISLQGFGPFGPHAVNPAERVVQDVAAEYPRDRAVIIPHVLTTSQPGVEPIPALLANDRPAAWIGVGLAAGRSALAVERVAINLADYRIPDEAGRQLQDQPIVPDGPTAYWSTLPVRRIEAMWRARDIPGYVSYSAGTFLCNQAFFLARHAAERLDPQPWVGFIHIPAMVEQVANPGAQPALPYQVLKAGLVAVVDVLVDALSLSGAPDGRETAGRRAPTPQPQAEGSPR
jgi:pyroglutamyl-peptidase